MHKDKATEGTEERNEASEGRHEVIDADMATGHGSGASAGSHAPAKQVIDVYRIQGEEEEKPTTPDSVSGEFGFAPQRHFQMPNAFEAPPGKATQAAVSINEKAGSQENAHRGFEFARGFYRDLQDCKEQMQLEMEEREVRYLEHICKFSKHAILRGSMRPTPPIGPYPLTPSTPISDEGDPANAHALFLIDADVTEICQIEFHSPEGRVPTPRVERSPGGAIAMKISGDSTTESDVS